MKELVARIRKIDYMEANSYIHSLSGIKDYFASEAEKEEFVCNYKESWNNVAEDRASYGDWQTPRSLAVKICKRYADRFGCPDIVIEPTCGLGAFVIAALDQFPGLKEIHGIEINDDYVRRLKQEILERSLAKKISSFPDIYIHTADFFSFDFSDIFVKAEKIGCHLALLGNPPWVTNSRQGRFESGNIPVKKNEAGLRGIDAITGRSNFDISEFIILKLLDMAENCRGGISILLKNSVVRNLVSKQVRAPKPIEDLRQYNIDAAGEFDVAVEASCFSARMGDKPSCRCGIYDFYSEGHIRDYGWVDGAFVSDIELYRENSRFDGISTYVWRSGIKHDCADVLELESTEDGFINKLGERVDVEEDMVYPLLKSSDISRFRNDGFRRFILVPQRNPGDDTSMLKETYPLAYSYLERHQAYFERRKSSIYKGKDRFGIFGIGEYSFKPVKILVSSLYKDFNFCLVSSEGAVPVMVDDTCYQLDFDSYDEASAVFSALMSHEMQSLLRSLAFLDGKRVITKSLLMRLDLKKYCREKGLLTERAVRMMQPVCSQPSLFD